ncbi:hypothetical protein AVEN_177082-1 [Araneus ventricosus]|uniref:Uncharacterized protein n=1 Tax=Araneus ventricosus TaxID=182803 RepID=A0A4Y2CTV6_ARAVE|nr:hypothetical protein AVEN_177082-1 [Araneus ventricosus]
MKSFLSLQKFQEDDTQVRAIKCTQRKKQLFFRKIHSGAQNRLSTVSAEWGGLRRIRTRRAKGRGGQVATTWLWSRRVPGSKPDVTEDPPCMGACCKLNHTWCPNVLRLVRRGRLERWLPAQASPSDRGSKLRGPSQNSPRVASKRDFNITNLNLRS